MNTILVVLALIAREPMPQYVIRYPTQQLCEQAAEVINKRHKDGGWYSREHRARCVPEVKGVE
jgi:hypothetical protein